MYKMKSLNQIQIAILAGCCDMARANDELSSILSHCSVLSSIEDCQKLILNLLIICYKA